MYTSFLILSILCTYYSVYTSLYETKPVKIDWLILKYYRLEGDHFKVYLNFKK